MQHDAMLAALRGVDEAGWDEPTDCARWTVRNVVAHLVGSLADSAHVSTAMRHNIVGRRKYRDLRPLDALNEAQVDDRREWPAERLLEDFERLAPKAVRARLRIPRLVRRIRLPSSMAPSGTTFGDLLDVIYIRDMWMHRVDIARATGQPFLTTESDLDVVAQVIRDLDRGWPGPPTRLVLTGVGSNDVGSSADAGSTAQASWLLGQGSPVASVTVDTVEFCRLLSGRPANPAYEIDGDPSLREQLNAARVVF